MEVNVIFNGIKDVVQFIIDLGPTVMMPLIFIIIGLIVKVKFSKALKGGLLVAVGFIGLNVIVTLLTDTVTPLINNMVKLFGLDLKVIDVGWPAASAIAFGTMVGVAIIPIGILINIIMLATKSTRTVNVDIWNFWHFAFSGSICYALTKNLFFALTMAAINLIVITVIADRTAPLCEKFLGLKGISFPHGLAASFAPIAYVLNWIIDLIPGVNKIKIDEKKLNQKIGIFGDPVIVGLIVGVFLGVLGFGFTSMSMQDKIGKIITVGVTIAAVLVITPKMAAILMEGVMPISEGIQNFIQNKFNKKRKLYIGLDCAAAIGNPVVLSVSVLLIPITIILALILPGNEFLPLVGLCGIVFQLPMIVAVTKGDFFRTFVIATIIMAAGLYIGTSLAPLFTEAAKMANFAIPNGAELISSIDYGSNPIPWLLVQICKGGWPLVIMSIIGTLGLVLWNRKKIIKEEKVTD